MLRIATVVMALAALAGGCSSTRECADHPAQRVWHSPLSASAAEEECSPAVGSVCKLARERGEPVTALFLSGGGHNAAFGAGFLKGWSTEGSRPSFHIVTGVSSGGLIATHAFLGTPAADAVLEDIFTTIRRDDVLDDRSFLTALFSEAFASTEPLKRLIARRVDDATIDAVAREADTGRQLWIGTVDMDRGSLKPWLMTDIARRARDGDASAYELYRSVLLATASVPAIMPPVEIGGTYYVDGGTRSQILANEIMMPLCGSPVPGEPGAAAPRVYVLVNGRIGLPQICVQPQVDAILSRSIDILLDEARIATLFRIQSIAAKHGMTLRIARIPDDMDIPTDELLFEHALLRRLFAKGYEMGAAGDRWEDGLPFR